MTVSLVKVQTMAPDEAGCILDGSSVRSADELCIETIRIAFESGMPPAAVKYPARYNDRADLEAIMSGDSMAKQIEWFGDSLSECADAAQEWMTENVAPPGYVFECNDGLYLVRLDEDWDAYNMDGDTP